jgi:hypothetical protein
LVLSKKVPPLDLEDKVLLDGRKMLDPKMFNI